MPLNILTGDFCLDIWKYYNITHKAHLLCNPINKEKFEKLCRLLRFKQGEYVLDIACGKGEFLVRLNELYDIIGVGVDISSYCIKDCLEKKRKRVANSDITFIEMDGKDYNPESNEIFDHSMCIGASWIYGGYRGTLQALKKMTKLGGLILVGEPFWLKEPEEEYLKTEELKKEAFGTHYDNVNVGEEEGLTCLYTLVSNQDDWDHYETLQWWNVDVYIQQNPEDPDNQKLLEKTKRGKESYLRWGRDTSGWAIYVFKNLARPLIE